MSKWYDNTVFYHMYPLGMSGAPFENREEKTVHRFQELEKWLKTSLKFSVETPIPGAG